MNEHIELVKKWLADPDSVTRKELKANADAAQDAYAAADSADAADAARYAYAAAYAAYAADAAAYWVEKYEALEQEDE
jgi:hypothetical protein